MGTFPGDFLNGEGQELFALRRMKTAETAHATILVSESRNPHALDVYVFALFLHWYLTTKINRKVRRRKQEKAKRNQSVPI